MASKCTIFALVAVLLTVGCAAKDFDYRWGFPASLGLAGGVYPDVQANVGDVLTYEWTSGMHGVVVLTSGVCPATFNDPTIKVIAPASGGNVTEIMLDKVGTYWYACQVGTHCANAKQIQKVVVSPAVKAAPGPAPKLAPRVAPAPGFASLRGAPAPAPRTSGTVAGSR